MASQPPEALRRYVRKYILGKPRVTGVLMSPEARQSIGLTVKDLLPAKTASATGTR